MSSDKNEDGYERVAENFKAHLQPSELEAFQNTSYADLGPVLQNANSGGEQSNTLSKLQVFFEKILLYERMLEQFPNSSGHRQLLCYIWGPMKSMILVRVSEEQALDEMRSRILRPNSS
jgi:hypothetical protein